MSNRVLGIVMLAVGVVLLLFGLNASDSAVDSVKEGLTGRYTDKSMWYLIGGGALAVGGALMAFMGRSSRA